ncbi:flagellar hook-length control protein FliK [Candidatus Omnitrophota bacterium]
MRMEGGFFLPVTPVSSAQNGSIAPALQGVSPAFSGEFSAFDIMMQQLLSTSVDLPIAFQQGTALPFNMLAVENPLLAATPLELTEEGMIDINALSQLLAQFNVQQPGSEIPQILQEIKDAYSEATALGQSQVNLGAIFGAATQGDITELTGMYQDTPLEELRTLFAGMREYFETQQNSSTPISEEQKLAQQTLEGMVKELFPEQSAQKAQILAQQAEMLNARNVTQEDIRQHMASQGEISQTSAEQADTAPVNQVLQGEIPAYLMPEFMIQGEVLPQGEQVLSKTSDGELFKQNNVNEHNVRETATFINGLSADDTSGENSANMDMRNSLNLTTEGQTSQTQGTEGSAETEGTSKSTFGFEQNLQRLQEAQSVIKQISKQVGIQQGMRTTEINMKLEPEHLGNMKISVKMQDQVINAQITVDNEHVKELLESNMIALKNSMMNSQIKVDKVEVEVSGEAEGTFINDAEQGRNLTGQQTRGHHNNLESGFAQSLFDGETPASSMNSSILNDLYQVNYLA